MRDRYHSPSGAGLVREVRGLDPGSLAVDGTADPEPILDRVAAGSQYEQAAVRSELADGGHLCGGATSLTMIDRFRALMQPQIYNETLRDLLVPDSTPPQERSTVTIREDAKGRIILTGLRQVQINSFEDLIGALNFGSSIRQTDATAINAKSSRSHAVFSLNLVQRKSPRSMMSTKEKRMSMPVESLSSEAATVTVDSKLHFVDLAGSERLKNTGASGERAKEGISINAGLASLGKVISQLSSRHPGAHVSYRDSKLTRLLQDSLGGNAITYMIACVTPAEFHLSETLNTVQYAQRARAIQSKPRIQQVTDESDKQAVIDRLKAEIDFLRQQLRNSEAAERKSTASQDRSDRPTERELELQHHLLDMQESYSALSKRHAKLIAELSKVTDSSTDDPSELAAAMENSSIERLKRSHSFAESVEQVVLEYEKTIQSLEASLSDTRTSLSNTESMLLERETRCAYVENLNAQLQARLQKSLDREATTESYLRDLESKLDGHASGEEKNAAIIQQLRKELARARENEANCEEYISTLEERLAENDQDMEMMQREIARLEHLVDRQRSLGKLDNLLYELDHIRETGPAAEQPESRAAEPTTAESTARKSRNQSLDTLAEAAETAIPEGDDSELRDTAPDDDEVEREDVDADSGLKVLEDATRDLDAANEFVSTPAQSRFVAEKLENVTQELLDLRMQHETTQNELDLMTAKYQEALRAMAEMQEALEESQQQARSLAVNGLQQESSFLDTSPEEEAKDGKQHASSRSLSSELSSVERSGTSQEVSEETDLSTHGGATESQRTSKNAEEVEQLRRLLQEHEEGMSLVAQKYAQLEAEHEETLALVEDLKTQLRNKSSPSPSTPVTPSPVIRRVTSQSLGSTVDRAHRSLAALRNIAAEEFEHRPDAMQNFENHLNTAMHELYQRMERIQALEAENASVKKEMETKATIISGLTRERSSLQGAKPVDMSLVSQLQEQIVQHENRLREMQETHERREEELRVEIEKLNQALEERTRALEERDQALEERSQALEKLNQALEEHNKTADASAEQPKEQDNRLNALQAELSEWEGKHKSAVEALENTKGQLQATSSELEAALASIEKMQSEHASALNTLNEEHANALNALAEEKAAALRDLEEEKGKQAAVVESLEKEIEEQKSVIAGHLETIANLEASLASAQQQQQQAAAEQSTKESKDGDVAEYQSRIAELEDQLDTHKALIESHKNELQALQESHKNELAELENKAAELESKAAEFESKAAAATEAAETAKAAKESAVAELWAKHNEAMSALRAEMGGSKDEVGKLLESISKVIGSQVTPVTLTDQLEDLISEKQHLADKYAELVDANEELLKQLEAAKSATNKDDERVRELSEKAARHESRATELAAQVANLEDVVREKEEVIKKKETALQEVEAEKQKSVRLVEELEEQITNTFDQHHNRLSVIQEERARALEEARNKITSLERELESYRSRCEQLEVRSCHSNAGEVTGKLIVAQLQLKNAGNQEVGVERTSSMSSNLRKSTSTTSLPSPPPAIPLPPLPTIASTTNGNAGSISPPSSRHTSKELVNAQLVEDQEARIRTIEKHLYAEKQLTATLEEALGDLEAQSNKLKADMESWKKKAWQYEDELNQLRKERNSTRLSLQAVEEERNARREAEAARAQLEERMNAINKKKKKSTLNCF